jgi:hypothetical protein
MFKWLTNKRKKLLEPWDFRTHLVTFGKHDVVTIGDAYEGIGVLGATGSGKTSGSGYLFSAAMLQQGFGGLVLCAKVGEAQRWRRLCVEVGRSDDLVVFDDSGEHQFNFLDYQLSYTGGGVTENIVNLLDETVELSERINGQRSGSGQEAFWKQGIRRHARNTIDLLVAGTGQICIEHLLEVMRDVPQSLAQANDPNWRENSVICMLLQRARARIDDPNILADLDQVEQYFLYDFPKTADRTRSVFEAGILGVLDLLARGKLHWLFGRNTTITPSACLDGKIIVVDLPVKSHLAIGLMAAAIWKKSFQQTMEQRSPEQTRPCFLIADEFQNFVSLEDMRFAATARSSKCVNFWLTQSVSNLYTALGSDEAGKAATDAILGLVNLKIFHANACPITNQWAAELIGRRKTRMRTSSISHGPERLIDWFDEEYTISNGLNESYEYPIMPHVFTKLKKGGPPDLITEAIAFVGGRCWNASGETYCQVTFKQGY